MGMETVWNSQSNWTIASGSIRDCITFQSSLSLLHDDDGSESTPTPLLLHPPSPDSTPCEIKITFAEKHELRQIYVRSTARVYEIYYAPNSRTNNDYLSTVRCGIAVRDDQVLRSPSIQNLSDDNVNKTEDDWIEVKVPDSPSQTKPYPDSTKTSQSQENTMLHQFSKGEQSVVPLEPLKSRLEDLYEATAEINDANPCISVTLRLLSLQNKGCVYVDEIYVFADPVDSADSESQESHNENSSSSSLMAMFLPLMQLSKTTGLSNLNSIRKEKLHVPGDDLEVALPSDSVIKTQLKGNTSITVPQEVKLNEVKGGWGDPSQLGALSQDARIESNHAAVSSQTAKMDSTCSVVPSKIAERENNHSAVPFQFAKTECNCSAVPSQGYIPESNHGDYLGGKVERALEQLVSRMDRIEGICLGFQEKMVMPMSSMEARLQRVEQQLDTLTKKLQTSALPSCSRISAPDASCIESDASPCEDCPDYTVTRENESDEKHLHTEVPYDSALMSDSENTTQFLPGLVVTAPEFLDGGDEEGDASGQETNSLKDKGKHSIDDALSSALASFLSSLSLDSPKYSKSLSVKAPEFSNEDDDDNESNNSEIAKKDQVHLTDSEEFSLIKVLASSNTLENIEKINPDSNDKHSTKTAQEADENDQLCSAEGDQDEVCVKTGLIDSFEEEKNGKISCQKSDISDELVDSQTPFGHSIIEEGPSAGTELTVAAEVPRKTFHENIIENVLGFALASSVVDFENPILDVKFISQRSPATERFLEDLLVGTEDQETSSRDQPVKKSNDDLNVKEQLKSNGDVSVEEQSNLISIEDGELVIPATDSHFAVDKDLCAFSIIAPANNEDDNLPLPEDHKRKRDQ